MYFIEQHAALIFAFVYLFTHYPKYISTHRKKKKKIKFTTPRFLEEIGYFS